MIAARRASFQAQEGRDSLELLSEAPTRLRSAAERGGSVRLLRAILASPLLEPDEVLRGYALSREEERPLRRGLTAAREHLLRKSIS